MSNSAGPTDIDWTSELPAKLATTLPKVKAAYFANITLDDLAGTVPNPENSMLRMHLTLAGNRKAGHANVRLYRPGDPVVESPGSALQIVTDDMPLLVESVVSQLARLGVDVTEFVHPILSVSRDAGGDLVTVGPANSSESSRGNDESWMHLQLSPAVPTSALDAIEDAIRGVLEDVRDVVSDTDAMRAIESSVAAALDDAATTREGTSADELREAANLLRWLADGHYTLLGYRRYTAKTHADGSLYAESDDSSGLGVLRNEDAVGLNSWTLDDDTELVNLRQGSSPAKVHRTAYPYFVTLFDAAAPELGEHRFVGVFTVTALHENVLGIPVIERRVRSVLDRAGLDLGSFSGQAMLDVLQSMPRSELFASNSEALFETVTAVTAIGRRREVKVFLREDSNGAFVSALVYMPRDRYTTQVRLAVQDCLLRELKGTGIDYTVRVTESDLALLHVTVRRQSGVTAGAVGASADDITRIETTLSEIIRTWEDGLGEALARSKTTDPVIASRYSEAFPRAYKQDFDADRAVSDIARFESLTDGSIDMQLYRNVNTDVGSWRFSLYVGGHGVSLSQVLPVLRSLGVEVNDERPYLVIRPDGMHSWLYDFGVSASREMLSTAIDENLDSELAAAGAAGGESGVQLRFTNAFAAMWNGRAAADRFNELIMRAGVGWRHALILRAYAKYLRQANFPYSQFNIEGVLLSHPRTARVLVALFESQFDPDNLSEGRSEELAFELTSLIEEVVSLDADRILRAMFELIRATLRTNFYVVDDAGFAREFLSLKLDSASIEELPKPKPTFEIFVYSPRVEGVHLRFGVVARGGLRWSDRREDFRTEVLGLAKAQAVKNAVIVPVGAKGGFVVKQPPVTTGDPAVDRAATLQEGQACYRLFIAGMLDVTDNLDRATGSVLPPARVVRRDSDDTYLVVAADKGTASFSDLANSVAAEYNFWLGDAFASGGSAGYDHKAMGITARGAWESVKRHFREIGLDTQSQDFTVVGVGDMSGDVFGNGMLLSRHIGLVAAFDHRHIFLDPNPDRASAFAERERLFALPRSSWAEYEPSLISKGGGVWDRTVKSIPVSAEARSVLGLDDGTTTLSPPELVRAILTAPVDLLWNGGIGTYIKSSIETNAQVGDKSNDAVRVDGNQLRATVVGEGGNLGATALGRIEFDSAGGRINTDAVDNSAGVDCSDHEVNIKILLESAIGDGTLDREDRDELLASMTDEVGRLVLWDNIMQNELLGTSRSDAAALITVHSRVIENLESRGLDRKLEALPSEAEIRTRRQEGRGLTSPELATLMAHVKLTLKKELLSSELPDSDVFAPRLPKYFPAQLRDPYADAITSHPLRRQLVATALTNETVDRGGLTFVYRLAEDSGATGTDAVRAFAVATEIFDLDELWQEIRTADISTSSSDELFLESRRVLDRVARWLLTNRPMPLAVGAEISRYASKVSSLSHLVGGWIDGHQARDLSARIEGGVSRGAPKELARKVYQLLDVFCLLDIIDVADIAEHDPAEVAELYFALDAHIGIDWLLTSVSGLARGDRWHSLARLALRDDLYSSLRAITKEVVRGGEPHESVAEKITEWEATNLSRLTRARTALAEIADAGTLDLATLSVAARQVRSMVP